MSRLPSRPRESKLPDSPHPAPVFQILTGSHKGKQFRLLSSRITIGRHRDCDVIFKDNVNCSKYHARIKKREGSYFIESLDLKNPVLINGKTISSQILKQRDKVTIGDTQLLFVEKAPIPFPRRPARTVPRPSRAKKSWLTPPRLIFILVLIGLVFLLTSEDGSKEQKEVNLGLRTESQVLEEVEALKKRNEEESEKKALDPRDKAAKVAFIKGFRDYRKGYFHRALKMFQHCLTLQKDHTLCQNYSGKSKVQIERLIQTKIRLGNGYKANKQYEACRAVFKNVEIMIQDPRNPVYKEARQNKKLCEIQLENQI